jgi:hypothetical protein
LIAKDRTASLPFGFFIAQAVCIRERRFGAPHPFSADVPMLGFQRQEHLPPA